MFGGTMDYQFELLKYLMNFNCKYVISHVDEQHMKFVVSLPLNTAQGSRSAAPMGRD